MSTQPAQQQIPEEIWSIYCGDINAQNTAKLITGLTAVHAGGVKQVHLLFQSWGGFVGDGVFLYNVLKMLPLDVILYNAGQVASAAVLAFLGAKRRKTTANAVFMIHKGTNPGGAGAGVERLKAVAANLTVDDARIEEILRSHLRLPDDLWLQFNYHDVYLSGTDALSYGLVDELAEFSPPAGARISNALG